MSKGCRTIYKTSRERAGLTQEAAVELLPIELSQLSRYESNKAVPADDIVSEMMDAYCDEYLGYLHLLNSKVGQKILPRGVGRCSILEAVVKTALAVKEYTKEIDHMMKAAIDGEISDDELKQWLDSKDELKEVVKGYLQIEFADGEI